MKRDSTPFPYETFADKDTFYGRTNEVKQLKKLFSTSNNLLLFAKRRMGKSTLIKKVMRDMEKDAIGIYIDIFDISSEKDFAYALINGLLNAQKGDIKAILKRIGKVFTKSRISASFDPLTAKTSIKIGTVSSTFEELIEEFFTALFEMSKSKKIILAIDEFQQISTIKNVKIDALLRKYIQQPYKISYVFLGSKRHILNSLFQYKAPLFELASPLQLESIGIDDTFEYVKSYLKINRDVLEYMFELSDGETKLTQHICHILYDEYKMKKEITKELVDEAIKEILILKNESYKILFNNLTTNQKKTFKLLTKYGTNIFSGSKLEEQNIEKTALQASLKQLFQKEYIDKDTDTNNYFVPDRTLELWGNKILN